MDKDCVAMNIKTSGDIGQVIRKKRKENGLTLHQAAAICGVSHVFLSELENGKESVRLNKVLQVTSCLGIEISARSRGWETGDSEE